MMRVQLAVVRSLWIVGALILLGGIVLLLVDQSSTDQICSAFTGICRDAPKSDRGAWIAGVGLLALIGTAVAWSTLTPSRSQVDRPPVSTRHRAGLGLGIAIGVLFILAAAGAAVDILS